MKTHLWLVVIYVVVNSVAGKVYAESSNFETNNKYLVVCSPQNDLFRTMKSNGIRCKRYDTWQEAVPQAIRGDALLVLADNYPNHQTNVSNSFLHEIASRQIRMYIEYPSSLPGLQIAPPQKAHLERAVVSDQFFGKSLPPLRILQLNGMYFLPVKNHNAHLVAAKVAGFDRAVYGLPEESFPLLFEYDQVPILVATTKLSQFITSRFAPHEAIAQVWKSILQWLEPKMQIPELIWKPTVSPAYKKDTPLPSDYELNAIVHALQWYKNSKLLIPASLDQELKQTLKGAKINKSLMPPPNISDPIGDGSFGIMQCYMSNIQLDGSQFRNIIRRGDNQCETAMTFALGQKLGVAPNGRETASNLLDYYLFDSEARKGPRSDPNHGAFGMIAWGVDDPAWLIANYGDDAARQMLGIMATAAALQDQRWNTPLAQNMVANLRTTGQQGFRPDRIDVGALASGWERYFYSNGINPSPHFEAYLWACFLWAYQQTGDELLYDRAEKAIRIMMEHYPDGWKWTNGLSQEKARMLLPLAWLVRVKDTPEHRKWLYEVGLDFLKLQHPCGAIQEEIGNLSNGRYPPPQSNKAYGRHEASLIQENGDPVSDLLYTTNFAFLGLHEAAMATGDPVFSKAENKLAKFLCRIQVRSDIHPELNGAWFRGFDFNRWEYWASNADAGWGAWCAITGWTHPWITSVLIMRQMDTSLWDLSCESTFSDDYRYWRRIMLPDNKAIFNRDQLKVTSAPVTIHLENKIDTRYPGILRKKTLTNGYLGLPVHDNGDWMGFEGEDVILTVDLGTEKKVESIAIQFLQITQSGIILPEQVAFSYSVDNTHFTGGDIIEHRISPQTAKPLTHVFRKDQLDKVAKQIRIVAKNSGNLPEWHHSANRPSWLFLSEVMINDK